jgi:hypothetical protein
LFDEEIGAIVGKYESLVNNILETTPGDHTYDSLRKQESDHWMNQKRYVREYFDAHVAIELHNWIVASRKAAELRLERNLWYVGANIAEFARNDAWEALIEEMWDSVKCCFGEDIDKRRESDSFVDDAVIALESAFAVSQQQLQAKVFDHIMLEGTSIVQQLQEDRLKLLREKVEELLPKLYEKHLLGYPLETFMHAMNEEYFQLKADLRDFFLTKFRSDLPSFILKNQNAVARLDALESTMFVNFEELTAKGLKEFAEEKYLTYAHQVLQPFISASGQALILRLNEISEDFQWEITEFQAQRHAIPREQVRIAGILLSELPSFIISIIQAQEHSTYQAALGWLVLSDDEFSAVVQKQKTVVEHFLSALIELPYIPEGKTLPVSALTKNFVRTLHPYLQEVANPFLQQWELWWKSIDAYVDSGEAEGKDDRNDFAMQDDDDDVDYDDEINTEDALDSRIPQSNTSVQEKKIDNKRNTTKQKSSKVEPASAPFSAATADTSVAPTTARNKRDDRDNISIEQQRERARQWAAENLGKKNRSQSLAPSTSGKYSVEEQRRRAAEYAAVTFPKRSQTSPIAVATVVATAPIRSKSAKSQGKANALVETRKEAMRRAEERAQALAESILLRKSSSSSPSSASSSSRYMLPITKENPPAAIGRSVSNKSEKTTGRKRKFDLEGANQAMDAEDDAEAEVKSDMPMKRQRHSLASGSTLPSKLRMEMDADDDDDDDSDDVFQEEMKPDITMKRQRKSLASKIPVEAPVAKKQSASSSTVPLKQETQEITSAKAKALSSSAPSASLPATSSTRNATAKKTLQDIKKEARRLQEERANAKAENVSKTTKSKKK